MRVRVAITGTLSRPRKEFVSLIETKTNAAYTETVDLQTDYLVSARRDTNKAKAAAKLGVTLLSESEMMSFIDTGHFPPRLPRRQSDLRNPEELASFCYEIETMGFQRVPSPSGRMVSEIAISLTSGGRPPTSRVICGQQSNIPLSRVVNLSRETNVN
jgi:hypothetical protein